jgi:ribosome modulation factor
MSASKRWKAAQRAMEKGKVARTCGKSKDDCPYKQGDWGLGGFWIMGYDQQEQLEREGREAPYPGNLPE